MREKKEIDIDEIFISRSIIGSTFETKIKEEFTNNGKQIFQTLIQLPVHLVALYIIHSMSTQ